MPPKKDESSGNDQVSLLGRPGNNVKMGIVGLPNVGKSSFFNLMTKQQNAEAANYPFCTINPNEAIVPVPDPRFKFLCNYFKPKSEVQPVLHNTDIAGLVKGAHEGAGLGNAFLSNIQSVDGIYHVTRAFADDDIVHVEGDVDPIRDLAIINNELMMKDTSILAKRIEAEAKNVERGVGGKEKKKEFETWEKAHKFLTEEKKDILCGTWSPFDIEVLNKLQLLTAKPVIYLVNLSKKDFIRKQNKWLEKIGEFVKNRGMGELVIPFSVQHEEEILDREMADSAELFNFVKENPAHKTALPNIIRKGYHALQLIHYFTCGKDEVRGWTVKKGALAPKAAGVIHTDFEKGFIKAEVYAFKDLKQCGSPEEVKKQGKYRMEGKNYEVKDGDIIFFKFNN